METKDIIRFASAVIPTVASYLGKERLAETLSLTDQLFQTYGMDIAKARLAIPDVVGRVKSDRAKRDAELAKLKAAMGDVEAPDRSPGDQPSKKKTKSRDTQTK